MKLGYVLLRFLSFEVCSFARAINVFNLGLPSSFCTELNDVIFRFFSFGICLMRNASILRVRSLLVCMIEEGRTRSDSLFEEYKDEDILFRFLSFEACLFCLFEL